MDRTLRKEVENGLEYLQAGTIPEVSFPYIHNFNQKIYYLAAKKKMSVSISIIDNRWVVKLKSKEKPFALPSIIIRDFDLDVLYASAVYINKRITGLIIFTGVTEQLFLSLNPDQQIFSDITILFSHRGMELSKKAPDLESYAEEQP